ncbi:MAG: hypothetical protein A2603_09485 [Bdellovibrionales bacterium RIFOXYD1_FULL_55_31]|nr:MAG: hypothetical protein A2603_09485 [Bdellovibrionales bacterium RIFOXYD1_FULL_55_31]
MKKMSRKPVAYIPITTMLVMGCIAMPLLSQANSSNPNANSFHQYRGTSGYAYHFDIPFYEQTYPFDFGAAVFLGADNQKRIVNLTPHSFKATSNDIETLSLDEDQVGYRLIKTFGIEAGIAPAAVFSVLSSPLSFNPYAGVVPIAGKKLTTNRFVPAGTNPDRMPKMRIPEKAADLESWLVGDQLQYETVGGVLFAGGIGSSSTAVAEVRYLALGRWAYYVEKTEENRVYLKITNRMIQSLSEKIGALTAVIDNSNFGSTDDRFSFSFRTDTPEGIAAFEDAMTGNLFLADEFDGKGPVERVASSRDKTRGRLTTLSIGFPFAAYLGKTTGTIHTVSDILYHQNNSESKVNYGIYLNEKVIRGALLIGRRSANDFYGTHYVTREADGSIKNGHWGQYVWAYENSKTSPKRLRHEIGQLIKQTGFNPELAVRIPETKTLGYTHSIFRMMFSQESTDELIELAVTGSRAFEEVSSELIANYFADATDKDDICRASLNTETNEMEKDIPYCKKQFTKATAKAILKIRSHLLEMSKLKENKPATFVKAFAQFGKSFLTNRFTVQTIARIATKHPIDMLYRIEGERISRYEKRLGTANATGLSFAHERLQ